jgi:hypothetical protein
MGLLFGRRQIAGSIIGGIRDEAFERMVKGDAHQRSTDELHSQLHGLKPVVTLLPSGSVTAASTSRGSQ